MTTPRNYRRPAFPFRPWITGALYDKYARNTVLHLDAYVMNTAALKYLEIWWHEGGRKLVAHDGYMIEPDGLTPIWQPGLLHGAPEFWTRRNTYLLSRVHRAVLALASDVERSGRWARVSVQCHYIVTRDDPCEPERNEYVDRKPYKPRAARTLPDWL